MKTNEFTIRARDLGTAAFRDGRKCVPIQDPALHRLLVEATNHPDFSDSLETLLRAWSAAWHAANVAEFI